MEDILAAVATSSRQTEVLAFRVPDIAATDGLLKVDVVGVCGTDVSNYQHIETPRILGHHVVGTVAQIGREAGKRWGVEEGDRVAMEEYIPCGQCKHCRTGRYRACTFTDSRAGGLRYGNTAASLSPSLWGGFAQYLYLHPNAVLHKLQTGVDLVEAVLTLPLSNGFEWMCIEGQVGPGKTVVIQGPGQQGLACLLAAKAAGAEKVMMVGRQTSIRRLELAKQLGADDVINISNEDVVERVSDLTGGEMADVVLDVTSGGTTPVTDAFNIVKKRGLVILAAYKYQSLPDFEVDKMITKSLTVKGLRGHSYESVEMAIRCIAEKRFPVSLMNSHNFGLKETDRALKTAGGEGESNPLLVAVHPWK